jgi:hypothetical protein
MMATMCAGRFADPRPAVVLLALAVGCDGSARPRPLRSLDGGDVSDLGGDSATPSARAKPAPPAATPEPLPATERSRLPALPSATVPVSLAQPAEAAASPPRRYGIIGFPPDGVGATGPKLGVPPAFHWLSTPFAAGTAPGDAPLPGGLVYIAFFDVDGDGRPSDGEPSSLPVPWAEDGLSFALNVPFGAGPGQRAVGIVKTETVRLSIDTRIKPPFLRRGRFLVAGTRAVDDASEYMPPPFSDPAWSWVSEEFVLSWPIALDAPLPIGLDALVMLDIDESGGPTAGDLAAAPLLRVATGLAGPLPVVLIGPVSEPAEARDE